MRNDFESNYLAHHGIKGQKWGKRNGPPYPLNKSSTSHKSETSYTKTTPRKELNSSDYIYKKGTVVGRFGGDNSWDQEKDITYLYTNEKDRSVYSNRFGGKELTYKFKKDVKMPKLSKQYEDLVEFVKNNKDIKDQYEYAINEPFDFWKDYINQGGKIANSYFSSMKDKGYDVLIDFRNVGMTEDPIIVISPKESLEEYSVKKSDHLAHQGGVMRNDFIAHHGIKGMKWGVRRYQNPDGSLTKAGKERYYSEISQYGEYKWRRLGKQGYEYNKKANKRADEYAGAVSYNVRKVNGEKFNREFETYKNANKKNNEHYLNERKKWLNNEGKYKGKDYYQFKDIARDEWLKTEDAKAEERAHKKLKDMVTQAAKGHPLYDKAYSRLRDVNVFDDENPVLMEQINYGKYAVDKVMRELEQESRKNHRNN